MSDDRGYVVAVCIVILLSVLCLIAGMFVEKPPPDTLSNHRHIDKEAGVVCWIFSGRRGTNISCVPLSQTELDR